MIGYFKDKASTSYYNNSEVAEIVDRWVDSIIGQMLLVLTHLANCYSMVLFGAAVPRNGLNGADYVL